MSSVAIFGILTTLLLCVGVPISITVGLSSMVYILLEGIAPMMAIQRLFAGVDQAALLAIPFFILAGDLMNRGGIAKRLVRLANKAVGNRTGGLAIVGIIVCMFFAAISGSGVATAAAVGGVMFGGMAAMGYPKNYSAAVIASASPIGVIIPPSISFVTFGVLTGCSIADLYKAGLPAGFIMGAALMVAAFLTSKKHGYQGKGSKIINSAEAAELNAAYTRRDIIEVLFALGTPVIIVGGVFGGWFTPTESAVIAVIYSLLIGAFVFKELDLKSLFPVFKKAALGSALIMFIISNATLFAWILAYEQIPQMLMQGIMGITSNKYLLLLIINVILLIAGCFMETGSIILIATPLLLPIMTAIGVDLVHFGIIITVNTAIGLLTPPFGVCLYTASNVAGVPVQDTIKRVGPFLIAMVIALMVITYLPEIILFMV
ncbi:MAG: TRAP transporter large permease [Christensenellales bacterium]